MAEAARAEIGVLCAYVPRELIAAAGFGVRVLSGLAPGDREAGLPANLCPHVRRAASFLAGPEGARLAGVVVADSCIPMLRLWDHLEAAAAPLPRWLLHVPRRDTPAAAAYFRGELERLAAGLAAAAGAAAIPEERLRAAIAERNGLRERCRRAAEGLAAGRISRLTPALLELFEGRAGCDLAAGDAAPPTLTGRRRRPRLMLVGAHFVTRELLDLLEGLGSDVCAVESCAHYRAGTPAVSEEPGADPLAALARGYLALPPCPRMEHGGDRAETVGRLAEAGAVDAVVYLLMRNCTPHAYAVPRWRSRLLRAGVPLLVLDVEDADWSQPRLVTRLEALLESLAERAVP